MIYIAQCINELKKIVFRNNLAFLQVVETVMAFFCVSSYANHTERQQLFTEESLNSAS